MRWCPRSLWLGLCLMGVGAGEAIAAPAISPSPGEMPEAIVVGRALGADVARRWCEGEEPHHAIEKATHAYLISRRINPDKVPKALAAAVGEEVSVEAFGQAFARCPLRAREVLRIILD